MKLHNIKYIEEFAGKPISEISKVDQKAIKSTLGYIGNNCGNALEEFCKTVEDLGLKLISRKKERKEKLLDNNQ